MPFIDEPLSIDLGRRIDVPKGFTVTPGGEALEEFGPARPGWNWGAAFRRNNEFSALWSSESAWQDNAPEPGFNPWDKIKGTEREGDWSRFVGVRNGKKFDAVARDIDRENEDRKILASQPWYQALITEGTAGILSPTTLLPGGAFVKGAKGGIALGRSAINVGLATGGSALAQETALHAIEQTRTIGESATAIGASTFLGGILGAGGAALLSKMEWQKGVAALERDLAAPARADPAGDVLEAAMSPASLGAAATGVTDLAGNAIAGRAAGVVAAATARMNPLLRALHSPSAVFRDVMLNTVENPLYLKKNFDSVASAPAVETLVKEYNAGLAQAIKATSASFAEHVKAGGQLDRAEFREAVGKAMRRGDVDPDAAVTQAAQTWRAKVFDPLKKAAIETGQLPADVSVDTAASYFSRMWNTRALVSREGEFKNIVRQWVEQNHPKWQSDFDKSTQRRLDPLQREIDDLEMAKLRRQAEREGREEEITAGEFNEADIRSALRIVEGGAPKPKGVKTLTQFVHEAGGLVDFSGELAHIGINNKSRPGFVRTQRMRAQGDGGGWAIDDMARHAWEKGYFPDHTERPSPRDFLDALRDDFNKHRAVVRSEDRDAFRLNELIDQLEADLSRVGAQTGKATKFATSEEVKGIVSRVFQALDAEAGRKIAVLKDTLKERQIEARLEREAKFENPHETARGIADDVFDTLTGKSVDGSIRPEFVTVKARGPLKERTFNIPDALVEQFLEHDVEHVGRRYTRVMGADVELARKFGSVDMAEQIGKIRDDYRGLRAGIADEKQLRGLADREKSDITDLEAMRDMLRGTNPGSAVDGNYARIVRSVNHFNYLRAMGEVAIASLSETVRPAMVHGLLPYMSTLGQTLTNLKGIRLSVKEAQLAGSVTERVLGTRLATLSEIIDPYASRGPVEAFMEAMTNVASKWNGIRLLTDMQKSIAAVMTQNRILRGAEMFGEVAEKERAYLAFMGVDQSMAERIAKQFAEHGETVEKVRVANTEKWTDDVALRTYRAAINKDVDSTIATRGIADAPLFASTPTGRAFLQFKGFGLASHQRYLLRGLQEDQARFVGGLIAMTSIGIMATWLKAVSANRTEKMEEISTNPGWWIAEGLDKAGIFSVPMELANAFEKASGFNFIKTPIKAFDQGSAISQKNQNRSLLGSIVGPTGGLIDDASSVIGVPKKMIEGEEITQAQKNAAERILPFNSYIGMRQLLRYVVNPQQP